MKAIQQKMEANQEIMEAKGDSVINAIQERMKAMIKAAL
jgi:hypothetical protein